MNHKIVYTYGAFDLLHPGHVALLEKAKELGRELIVGIVADEPIRKLKGDDRPIQSWNDRATMVSALKCVNRVVYQPNYNPTSVLLELPIKIDILVKGDDWESTIEELINDKKLRRELGKNARDYVIKHYDISIHAHKWAEAYNKLFNQQI